MYDLELIICGQERDLGGFSVRRILPHAQHRMVGPFIFFDHIGPANFKPDEGIDVRPHPHIGLATVTYLFDGKLHHRDSLGSDKLIEPGAINWMTAGRGIVHSERTPDALRKTGGDLSGLQCWVALPEEFEETEPSFTHYTAESIPEFTINKAQIRLLIGEAFGYKSPVKTHSDIFYFVVKLPRGAKINFALEGREGATYVVEGRVSVNKEKIEQYAMAIGKKCGEFEIEALEDSQLMLLGGKSLGERHIFWNFVASTKQKIEAAKIDWARGPGDKESRFPKVPGDEESYIPLPETITPRGTIM